MIQQWQSEYDTATVKKSFHEIDFEKLARKYIPRDNEVELEKSITTSGMSLKAETKYVIGRNIRILRKCLLPEVELLENKHLLMFLNNIIKFTKIEHLYLLSTPEVQFSSQISPNVHFSARRIIRLVSDIHLMYSFADSQKGDDFRKAKNLFEYIINVLKKDFCPLIAKHHRSPPKDKSNYSLLEYLIQLNAHLENFDRVLDHKEYTKICSEMGSMTNFEDNSFTRHSPILKGEKVRSNYSSVSHTDGLSDKSTSSYLSTESNSLRNKMRERREILGHSHMQAFGHSRIASTSFEQMPGSLLSSGISLTKGEPADNAKNASTITVEYVKNIQMYSRTLGDLKQYKELKGLKLINEIDVFPKLEDEESRKKNSPLKQRIIKLREEEQHLDPFSMLEIGQLAGKEIKVTVTEPHRQLLKTWEEAKRREEEEQKLFEEQKRLAEKRRKAERGKDQKDVDESNSEDDEQHFREVKKIEYQRSRTIVAKDIEEDEHNLIMHTFQSSPDSSPAIKINNYTFYRSETLEYQIPAMDYLEKTEKVIELPSEFAEEENIDDYCYKKGSSRRQFLTKLFGEKTRQKLYQDLDDIYSASPIKTSENNGLTEDLINQLRDGLENKKIKKLAKAGASKESVFFLQKQRQVISTETEVEKKEEEVKKKDKKGNRASVMWAKLRFAVIMRAFAKRLNGKEISFVNFRTKKLLAYLTQNLNNETKEEMKMKNGYPKAPTKPIGRIIKRKETGRIFSSFQGAFLPLNSDKGEIDV